MMTFKEKAAIYIRVSTHWQIDKDSLQVQRRELELYCSVVLGINDVVIFEDAGFSAKNTDRPEYQKMMERVMNGEFTHIVVWKIDRISRNLLDFSEMYKQLKRLGVTFVSKNEQFDTSTAIGEAMLKIILVFAELERKMTSERVYAVMLSRANNGQWNGGRIPYGYDYDKKSKSFSVNKEQADTIRKMYDLYMQSKSLIYVSDKLNSMGIKSSRGNNFSPVAVHKILCNPWTYGKYQYNLRDESEGFKFKDAEEVITVDEHHEPILPPDSYEIIRNTMISNRRTESHNHFRKYVHPFAGLVRCGVCGRVMNTTIDRPRQSGFSPSVHSCGGRRTSECTNKSVNDNIIAPFIFNLLSNILIASSRIEKYCSIEEYEKSISKNLPISGIYGTKELYDSAKSGISGFEYRKQYKSKSEEVIDVLSKKKRKTETAISRLQSLYLYSESAISEKDFVIQMEQLKSDLSSINEQIEKEKPAKVSEDFESKASYFLMIKQLSEGNIEYEKVIRNLSPIVVKEFMNRVISYIQVVNGKVTEVSFKNGCSLSFK